MADEVHRLVVAPFQEIVDKGRTTIENAKTAGEEAPELMLKAARNLVKEGERALKRVEPLCTKNYEDYGGDFIDAIKESDEIAQYRSELEDLLWDFDDFVEVDGFDADKFEDLRKASRKSAPRIVDLIKRMKLAIRGLTPPIPSRAASATPDTNAAHSPDQMPDSLTLYPPSSTVVEKLEEEAEVRLRNLMGSVAGPDQGLEGISEPSRSRQDAKGFDTIDSRRPGLSPQSSSESPPRSSSTDPWQVNRVPSGSPGDHPEDRDRSLVTGDSPTIPRAGAAGPHSRSSNPFRYRNLDQGTNAAQDHNQGINMRSTSQSFANRSDGSLSSIQNYRWTNSTQSSSDSSRIQRSYSGMSRSSRSPSYVSEASSWQGYHRNASANQSPGDMSSGLIHSSTIPENAEFGYKGHSPANSLSNILSEEKMAYGTQSTDTRPSSRHPSTESVNSSVFDVVDCTSMTSPFTASDRSSLPSTMLSDPCSPISMQPPAYPGHSSIYQNQGTYFDSSSGLTITNQSNTTLAASVSIGDDGLIPVDMEHPMLQQPSMPPREPDCLIGPSSSFYRMRGFCKGAEEALRGQPGYKKVKRPLGGFSFAVVAKCIQCLYELDYRSVEQDLNNDPAGNFTASTIGFRLRVLQKSHLPAKHADEQLYGCIYCIQQGHTLEEGDATVFFNQKQLFAHMARHPRPLPEIQGITVVDSPEVPQSMKDNFDLHFAYPPIQSVMTGLSRELARLPSAVALETRNNINGIMRAPPDRTPVLHFAISAKIVGIEFPAKYEGKWGIGWHDGVRAAFEADSIQLDAPPTGEVKMQGQGSSNIQAVARWKWSQKGDDRWLKFDKGDTIKNIGWVFVDHWCWSGTSPKGWGIFPQSHLEPNSIRTSQPGDATSTSSNEKKGPLRFSIRKISDRNKFAPVASTDSTVAQSKQHIY